MLQMFESSVIHKGTKTKDLKDNPEKRFESSVIHKGTKTKGQIR